MGNRVELRACSHESFASANAVSEATLICVKETVYIGKHLAHRMFSKHGVAVLWFSGGEKQTDHLQTPVAL